MDLKQSHLNYRVIGILILFMIASCATDSEEPKVKINVQHQGSMHLIMQNDLSAQVDLNELKSNEYLYALGALEDLRGEIMILAGEPYISKGSDSGLVVEHSFDYKAALLVQSTVEKWSSYPVPDSMTTVQQFEAFLPQMANDHGIDTSSTFPFLLEGTAASFRFHVVNWKEGNSGHSHETHKKSGPYGLINGQEVQILGFYSSKHHGEFTHHNTDLHMHVKTPYQNICGHLDELTLGKGMMLKLPQLKAAE